MLAALQTIFFREHNRVAGILTRLNPRWTDETTFQEARRVVVAQWQLLTYRDWLKYIIGQCFHFCRATFSKGYVRTSGKVITNTLLCSNL